MMKMTTTMNRFKTARTATAAATAALVILLSSCCLTETSASPTYDSDVSNSEYESWTAEEKHSFLLEQIELSGGTKGRYPSFFGLAQFLLQDDLSPTVDHFSDFVPYQHEKRIHSVGVVGSVEFQITTTNNNPYTGIFQTGSSLALLRLSLAAKPKVDKVTGGDLITPGLGLKFLRGPGVPSANVVAMESVDAQLDPNFFALNFSNHIPATDDFLLSLIAQKFARVTAPAEAVGLSDMARMTTYNEEEDDIVFPFELRFVPNVDLNVTMEALTSIPVGTELYRIYARAEPSDSDDELELLGVIKLQSELMESAFGDNELFFRHDKFENDLLLRPEWKQDIDDRHHHERQLRGGEEKSSSSRPGCPLGFDQVGY